MTLPLLGLILYGAVSLGQARPANAYDSRYLGCSEGAACYANGETFGIGSISVRAMGQDRDGYYHFYWTGQPCGGQQGCYFNASFTNRLYISYIQVELFTDAPGRFNSAWCGGNGNRASGTTQTSGILTDQLTAAVKR